MAYRWCAIIAGLVFAMGTTAAAQTPTPATRPAGTTVLDTTGTWWRTMITWKTPSLCDKDGEIKPLGTRGANPKPVSITQTAWPDEKWIAPEFDDLNWERVRGGVGPGQRLNDDVRSLASVGAVRLVCVRGKFRVSDPAAVGPLKIDLVFHGGCVVYVNGKELARANMPAGELTRETLAEHYPLEAYIRPDGKLLTVGGGGEFGRDSLDFADRFALRMRKLSADIPADRLRKGVNVVAIAIHAAPLNEVLTTGAWSHVTWRGAPGPWEHARLVHARMSGPGTLTGLTPNAGRPAGVQVWSPHPWGTANATEYGDACEGVQPIRLVAPRNAVASGQFVVSAAAPVSGLKVVAGDLAGSDAHTIPASAVQVRWLVPSPGNRFDGLIEASSATPKSPFQPVWVTVNVAADVTPGPYHGEVSVSADGLEAVKIPITLKVHGWQMPPPANYDVRNHWWQSHDAVALTYKEPLWSDKHFELMGKSLEMSAPLGNKFCALHLITPAEDIGNAQSFVRWVDKAAPPPSTQPVAWKPDGQYEYDFSVFDRYLDLYAAKVGKPTTLLIDVWAWGADQTRAKSGVVLRTEGPMKVRVSLRDRASGKVSLLTPPYYGTPAGLAFWKPVLAEVRQRLEKRGWMDVAQIGTGSDNTPRPETVAMFNEIWPGVPWFSTGHVCPSAYSFDKTDEKTGAKAKVSVPVRSREWVWGCGGLWSPGGAGANYPTPWGPPTCQDSLAFPRDGSGAAQLRSGSTLADHRLNPERALQCGLFGIGRVCLDMWPINGRLLCGSPGQYNFCASITSLFDAAPDGPRWTARAQMFREGIQVREAMTWLQRQAKGGTLDAATADRIKTLLDQRARNMLANDGHRYWLDNDDQLFSLCTDIATKQ